MEQITLKTFHKNLVDLREMVEELRDKIMENDLEVNNEVISEIEGSRHAPEERFVSQEDIEGEFIGWVLKLFGIKNH